MGVELTDKSVMAGKHPHFLKFKMKKREQEARRKRGETDEQEVSEGELKVEKCEKEDVFEEKKMSKKQKKKMKKLTEVGTLEDLFEKVVEKKELKTEKILVNKRGHSDDSAPIPAKLSKFCFAKLKK